MMPAHSLRMKLDMNRRLIRRAWDGAQEAYLSLSEHSARHDWMT